MIKFTQIKDAKLLCDSNQEIKLIEIRALPVFYNQIMQKSLLLLLLITFATSLEACTGSSCPDNRVAVPTVLNNPSLSNQFTLTFQYACRPGKSFQTCLGDVVWNDQILVSVVPSDYKWNPVSIAVTARPGKNFLQFIGAGVSDSYGLLINTVKLVRHGTADNIVVNGDFSSPNVNGNWGIFDGIAGWKGKGIEVGYGPSCYGIGSTQMIELDGNVNYQITQYFYFDNDFNLFPNPPPIDNCCIPKLTYKLEFDWAVRTTLVSSYDTSKASVTWNDEVVASLGYNGNTNIKHETITVALKLGENILAFDGTSFGDRFGITVDNVKLTSDFSKTNLIVNGEFTPPSDVTPLKYFDGGIPGWSCVKAEVGVGSYYNPAWGNNFVIELDADTNQRYSQVIFTSPQFFSTQIYLQAQGEAVNFSKLIPSGNLARNN